MNKTIKVVSRDSQLAIWQTEFVINEMKKIVPEASFEIIKLKTKGDKKLDVSLSKIGDKGLFTQELEEMLLNGQADFAVHSLKDMPTTIPKGLELSCFLERYDHRDAFLSKHPGSIVDLPEKAIVGTSSLRRKSQLLALRPDLEVVDLRGNINTRLKKFHEQNYDAAILAVAGLERLNLGHEISEKLDENIFLPAVGQGVLVVESRENASELRELFEKINHEQTYECVTAERDFMKSLEGGCQVPIAAYASIIDGQMILKGFVGSLNGEKIIRSELNAPHTEFKTLGKQLAELAVKQGAKDILSEIR